MKDRLAQWLAKIAARAIGYVWKRKEDELLSTSIQIGGKTIPLSIFKSLAGLVPTILGGVEEGKTASQIASELKEEAGQEALAVIESVANIFFPGSGTAIEVIDFILTHRVKQTQEEVNQWMDRFGISGV